MVGKHVCLLEIINYWFVADKKFFPEEMPALYVEIVGNYRSIREFFLYRHFAESQGPVLLTSTMRTILFVNDCVCVFFENLVV